MLVYGDAARATTTGDKLACVRHALSAAGRCRRGIEAHAALVAAFIEMAELAQGVADAAFTQRGEDTASISEQHAIAALRLLADAIARSWQSGMTGAAHPATLCGRFDALATRLEAARPIRCNRAEGYAHYALYPESYVVAARNLSPQSFVIGIRSIGLGLAVLAAAGAKAEPPISLRPVGHPFRRSLALSASLKDRVTAHRDDFAIADEGPGLSGSSFGAVADLLEDAGVDPARITFLPSHAGEPGPACSSRHLARWRAARRHVVDFDALVLRAARAEHRLPSWTEDLTGPAFRLDDLSAGRWRMQRAAGEWPPAYPQQERRKFLLRSERGAFLLKFAGLGFSAETKLTCAQRLHDGGFTPEPLGCRHGFLVERWLERAAPAAAQEMRGEAWLAHLARYLAFRARHLPAAPGRGASLAALSDMLRVNVAEGLGTALADALDRYGGDLSALERHVRPVRIDGRLHAWEWLRGDDGRMIKTDALDHHAAHDLVGCQDIAWDIAGAAEEFALTDAACEDLRARVSHGADMCVVPSLVAFLRPCYLAFQLGLWSMAAASAASDPADGDRCRRAAAGYAEKLRRRIGES